MLGLDCLNHTVLSNHLHLVFRSRPGVVATWLDDEVARRWLKLFPKRRKKDVWPEAPSKPEIDMIVDQPDALA